MAILVDTNVLLAVVLDEPERPWLIEATRKAELAAPDVLPFEVANALSGMVRRQRISPAQAMEAFDLVGRISVEMVAVDARAALALAVERTMYAYDAYFLQAALQLRCPLLTLDQPLRRIAASLGVTLLEKP